MKFLIAAAVLLTMSSCKNVIQQIQEKARLVKNVKGSIQSSEEISRYNHCQTEVISELKVQADCDKMKEGFSAATKAMMADKAAAAASAETTASAGTAPAATATH